MEGSTQDRSQQIVGTSCSQLSASVACERNQHRLHRWAPQHGFVQPSDCQKIVESVQTKPGNAVTSSANNSSGNAHIFLPFFRDVCQESTIVPKDGYDRWGGEVERSTVLPSLGCPSKLNLLSLLQIQEAWLQRKEVKERRLSEGASG